jgi:hypothetical protein
LLKPILAAAQTLRRAVDDIACSNGSEAGRPLFDPVMMPKVLVI